MKEYYELKKVVDPHQHMPKNIRGYLLDGMRYRELNNDSFIHWTVGEYKDEHDAEQEEDEEEYESDPDDLEYEEDEEFDEYNGEDDYEQSVELLAKVDAFLLKHFKKGEEIIILYWW